MGSRGVGDAGERPEAVGGSRSATTTESERNGAPGGATEVSPAHRDPGQGQPRVRRSILLLDERAYAPSHRKKGCRTTIGGAALVGDSRVSSGKYVGPVGFVAVAAAGLLGEWLHADLAPSPPPPPPPPVPVPVPVPPEPEPECPSTESPRLRCDLREFPSGSYRQGVFLRWQRAHVGASPEQRTLAVKQATHARRTRPRALAAAAAAAAAPVA